MTTLTTPAPSLAQVFAELYRNRNRGKLTPEQVAENIGTTDVNTVSGLIKTVFLADLLHMAVLNTADGTRHAWHYGITRRARRIVKALGLDGVTDQVIGAEYHDSMAWKPRKKW
jgi:hypothetical protein